MSKTTHFFGNSVFGQLISLIDSSIISKAVQECNSDHYVKKFTTKDHLISMLFCSLAKCVSLREVCGAMLGLSGKTEHFQLNHIPKKSTLADANERRDVEVFGKIYESLLKKYRHVFSDSRIKAVIKKQIKIFDSTTLSLFHDILKCVGRPAQNGKKKGGIKVHTVINVDEMVPTLIWFTEAAKHDHILYYSKTDKRTYKPEKERIYYEKQFFDVKTDENGRFYSDVYVRDIWDCDITKPLISGSKEYLKYNTQKPKALIERIIKASSNEGDTVADYYLGSGTTAVVCKELGRNFIGCDINPKAIEITNARLDAVS